MKTSSSENFEKGSLWKQILLFSLPLVATNVLQILFNMSDIAVVGKFGGPNSLGAVGSTTTLVTLFTGFLIGLGNGVNALLAKFIGQKNQQSIHDTIHVSFVLSIIMGLILTLISELTIPWFLSVLGTQDVFFEGATNYLRIYMLGMPALAIFNYGNAVFSAMGNTRRPLIFLLCSGIINVALNLFFVIVCKLDVMGVALASIISQYISALLIVISIMRFKGEYKLTFAHLKLNKNIGLQVLKLGIPAGFQNSIFAIANLFIQSGVNSLPKIMVDGNSAAANADALIYDVMAAFYVGCSTFMAQNYGAKNKSRVMKSYLVSLTYSFGAGLILGLLLVVFGRQFLSLFTNSNEVIDAGMKRIMIMGFSYGFCALMDNSIAGSRGLGKTIVPTIIVITGSCVFRIIWIYTIFAHFKTIPSLYLLYIFSWLITGIAELIYFISVYKKAIKEMETIENN